MYGDRVGLWREVIQEDSRRKRKLKSGQKLSGGAREARVNRLAGLKRVGKAVQAIISPGLAEDTPKVEQKLRSKFPPRSFAVDLGSHMLPEAAEVGVEGFVNQVRSFSSSAGPGPTGLRPQFFKELVGENGEEPCVEAMYRVAMLFVDGRVPRFLARFYAGGTLVGIVKSGR